MAAKHAPLSPLASESGPASPASPLSTSSAGKRSTSSRFVVAAIDFGTTYSGYAFSFTRDPDSIHVMRRWEGGDPGVNNQKLPTSVLMDPSGKFLSFGYSARDDYHDLDPADAKKYLYFEKFKMSLHSSEELHKGVELTAANGKKVLALRVFACALHFFKEHCLQELSDQSSTTILNSDIRWVITVPAIWKQPAKQFMRQAAYEAGLASPQQPDQLLIALEPEAASIYCQKLKQRELVQEEASEDVASLAADFSKESANPTRYIVVDCGGGTVDVTVHEMEKGERLKELHKASGGAWGSIGVDREFENLLSSIFSDEFIENFKMSKPAGWVDMMIAFEAKKRTANPKKTSPLNISLPFAFIEHYSRIKGQSVEYAIKKFASKDIKWSSQGMLRLAPAAMQQLFVPVVTDIVQHVQGLLDKEDCVGVKYLFLVGGFAESLVLQAEIRSAFSERVRVIIPQDTSLAILRGAVLFGLNPTVVRVRRSALTYGVGVLNEYDPAVHPSNKLVEKGGLQWCTDVFDTFVTVDQPVALGDVVTRSYTPAKADQVSTVISIFSCEGRAAQFTTDRSVRRCGELHLEMPDTTGGQQRELQTSMMFGDTEIKVMAVDLTSGKKAHATIDFLNK
eukprot:scpid44333/ scgid28299/ Heat shock 70 kDa protein 12A